MKLTYIPYNGSWAEFVEMILLPSFVKIMFSNFSEKAAQKAAQNAFWAQIDDAANDSINAAIHHATINGALMAIQTISCFGYFSSNLTEQDKHNKIHYKAS